MQKGDLSSGYIPNNKFSLLVLGLATEELKIVEISGIEQELETVDLPDKTVATSGRVGTTEFTIKVPAHETNAMDALNAWWVACQGTVLTDYKKNATLALQNTFGATVASWAISGMFPTKRALPELNAAGAGDLSMAEWTFKADDVQKI